MTDPKPLPHPDVRYMLDASGKPTQQAYEFLERLVKVTKDANAAIAALQATTYAPTGAQYVLVANDGTLSADRKLTAGANISLTDGGANGDLTIAVTGLGASSGTVIAASSGTTVTITNIPAWDILIFAIAALSHNGTGGANQTLTIETSTNNGSSWSPAVGLTVGTQAAATSSSGALMLFNTASGHVVGGNVGSQTASAITNSIGAVNAVRFSWSLGGSFDDGNGTITYHTIN